MIDFIIVGFPRSGTTWAANWLNTEQVYCVHDPLWETHYRDLDAAIDARAGDKIKGIVCTGLWRWPQWLNDHPARVAILCRPIHEVRVSMASVGLHPIGANYARALDPIVGRRFHWLTLFDESRAADLWEFVTNGRPFDRARHRELVQMRIEPKFDAIYRNPDINRALAKELGL